MTHTDVEVRDDDGIRRITLDRPDKRNAMTIAMFDAVADAVDDAVADDAVRVVVLRGRGDHFCAGAEIGGADARGADGEPAPARPRTGHLQRNLRASPHRMIRALYEAEIPIVSGVQGYAAGIGMALALAGDHVVAARSARFWVPFVARGFTPDSATTFLLPHLVGVVRAKQMILRGERIDGARAAEWGLVSEVVDDDGLDDAVEVVAREFATGPTVALGLARQLVHRNLTADLAEALEREAITEELAVRSDDFKEGMRAFVDRRDPDYTGR
jgi:2-(1,2-epoxy-1,2-dihydrophenyl)acetyl-CoA isomerase